MNREIENYNYMAFFFLEVKVLAFIKFSKSSYINQCHSSKQMAYTNWDSLKRFK